MNSAWPRTKLLSRLPLHDTPEVEELVTQEETYWVVRKTGEAGDYVEQLDPRTP